MPTPTPIRILHTADIHIGMENYGRVDPNTGINARVMDFLRRLSDIADYAIQQQVDLFLFAGDAYRTREPSPTHQREFARRIKQIADAGIPVLLLVGNHDLPAVPRRATSVAIFDTLQVPNVHVADREALLQLTCRRGQPLQVATVPYPLRTSVISREEHQGKSLSDLDALMQRIMIANLQALAQQARANPAVPAVLVGHFSVNEASLGSEQNIMVGRDMAIPRSVLLDPVWRYVALGHIHKHQSLNGADQPPVIYSGSIERIDFGEEREPKGFVLTELGEDRTTWQFLPGYRRQARPFLTIRVDVRQQSDPLAAILQAIEQAGDLTEAVVRLSLRLLETQEPQVRDRQILRALESAYFVAPLQTEVDRSARSRLGAVSVESLSSLELLQRYLHLKDVPPQRQDLLLGRAKTLIDQVEGENT